MLFMRDGKIVTSSRGGQNYDIPATNIINDIFVKELFTHHSNVILDGELYIHGKPLSYISGLCRLEKLDPKHQDLEFHCYDIVDESKNFVDRLEIIKELRKWIHPKSKLKFVIHIADSGKDSIMERHNIAVQYWTINDTDDMEHLREIGADCIMSDIPDVAYDILNA